MKNKKSTFQCCAYMGEEGINIYSESSRVIELLAGDFVPFIPEWRVEEQEAKNSSSLECVFGNQQTVEAAENGNFFITG